MKKSAGFTIIELMIATSIFSILLLVCSFALIQIARSYYKGVTSSQTQDAARSIVDQISQGIQFSGNNIATTPTSLPPPLPPSTGSSYIFCIGDQRYSVQLNQEVESNPTPPDQGYHALVVDTYPGCTSGSMSQNLNSNSVLGRELLPTNMRLSKLSVTQVPGQTNLYSINVRVVYGDSNLLCSPIANDCNSSSQSTYLTNSDIACKNTYEGTQFCAVSELDTVVQQRI
jgi:prepilin-type N-terminal cleavage/methylation domain-containing protein